MTGNWTYDPSTNILTVTGGTSQTPAGFVDAWNADKAGTLQLFAPQAAPFDTTTLTRQMRPADDLSLMIYFKITNFVTAGTFTIHGTDQKGNTIYSSGTITQNATYQTNLWFATITRVVAEGDYTVELEQHRWGIVSRMSALSQWSVAKNCYLITCGLQTGDGTTATYFAENDASLMFNSSNNPQWRNKANSTVTLGTLVNASTYNTKSGVYLITTYGNETFMSQQGTFYLYGSKVVCKGGGQVLFCDGTVTAYNCICDGYRAFQNSPNGTLYNIYFGNNISGGRLNWGAPPTILSATVANVQYAFYWQGSTQTHTIYNVKAIAVSAMAYAYGGSGVGNFVDCENMDSADWVIGWGSGSTTRFNRQYTFDLTTEPGATVVLKRSDGTEVFSTIADTAGAISAQTVTKGYYTPATGNALQDYGPFTLIIRKVGKITYTDTSIALDQKTTLKIALHDQLTGTATANDVAEGATFYGSDADTQLRGALVAPAVFVDVAQGKPVLNLNRKKADNQLVFSL